MLLLISRLELVEISLPTVYQSSGLLFYDYGVTLLIKARVEGVEVLRVKVILRYADGITDLTLSNRLRFYLVGEGRSAYASFRLGTSSPSI